MKKNLSKIISIILVFIIAMNLAAPGFVYAENTDENEDSLVLIDGETDNEQGEDPETTDPSESEPDTGEVPGTDPGSETGETAEETETEGAEPEDTEVLIEESETEEEISDYEPYVPVSGLAPQAEVYTEDDYSFPASNSAQKDEISLYESLVKKVRKALLNGKKEIDVTDLGIVPSDYLILSDFQHNCPYIDGNKVDLQFWRTQSYYTQIELIYSMSTTKAAEYVQAVDEKVQEVLSHVNPDMTDLEKAVVIHDYLASHGAYDTEFKSTSYFGYSILMKNKGVCQSYASMFMYLMNKLDVDTYVVMSESHEWNIIKINGEYYNVDVTFDDPTYDIYAIPQHAWFLISDARVTKIDDSRKVHKRVQYEQTCTSTVYDAGGVWSDAESAVAVHGGYWYFVRNGSVVRYDTAAAAYTTVDDISWHFSGMFRNGHKIYYNSSNKVKAYNLTTGKITAVGSPDTSGGNIYGINDYGTKIKYAVGTNAYSQNLAIKTLEGVTLVLGCDHELEYVASSEPTCTVDGMPEHYVCIHCGALFDMNENPVDRSEIAIPALGHTAEDIAETEPTLSQDGHTAGSRCTVCGQYLVEPKTTYRVVLSMNGGVFGSSSEDIPLVKVAGEDLDLSEFLPSRFEYKFRGWSWDPDTDTADYVLTYTEDMRGTLYACWRILPKLGTPLASHPDAAQIQSGTSITLTAATGSSIYFSIDGSEPGPESGILYSDSIDIIGAPGEQVVLKAVAAKKGYRNSDIASYVYTILDESSEWGDITEEDRAGFATAYDIPEELWVSGVRDMEYRGTAQTQEQLRVYHGKTLLVSGKDYTVSYKNNKNAGKATLTISGKGNYSGKIRQQFSISPIDLETADVTVTEPDLSYTGKVQKAKPVVRVRIGDGKTLTLKAGTDFKCVYPDSGYKQPGTYTISVEGIGNYEGAFTTAETIRKAVPLSKVTVSKVGSQKFTGAAVEPVLKLTYTGTRLQEGADYTVEFRNNISVGKATAVITGTGKYVGTRKISFSITGSTMAEVSVVAPAKAVYTGSEVRFAEDELSVISEEGAVLTEGLHYSVKYKNNISAGTATVTLKGIPSGGYTGSVSRTFKIAKYVLTETDVILSADELPYMKGGAKPQVTVRLGEYTLTKGEDYTVSFSGASSVGTASVTVTGKGSCTGTVTRSYTVLPGDLGTASASAPDVVCKNDYGIYASAVVIRDINGEKLKKGTDYTAPGYYYADETEVKIGTGKNAKSAVREAGAKIGKKDVIPAGTVIRAVVNGMGNYTGETAAEFRFVTASLSKATVSVKAQTYTGRPVTLKEEQITVKLSGKALTGQDFDIVPGSYKNNIKAGTASVKICGIGNYGGVKTVQFRIKAKSMSYRIVYNANGGSGTMKASVITTGEALAANKFKCTNKSFAGWNTAADGSGVSYTNKERFTLKDGTVTFGRVIILYAQWQ